MPQANAIPRERRSLLMSKSASQMQKSLRFAGISLLFIITSLSLLAVLFIIVFIAKDAYPFFVERGFKQFFTNTHWYPTAEPAVFGSVAVFVGSGMVTIGAVVVAVPLGICAALCLSDILPFWARQLAKPIVEILASIPSVAYGFFALMIFAPLLQDRGGALLGVGTWIVGLPFLALAVVVLSELLSQGFGKERQRLARYAIGAVLVLVGLLILNHFAGIFYALQIKSGTNALNVSIILGIMALPTVVSMSEDALQAVGPELRMGSYALGATRAETLIRTVLPAASSGILAAVLLGVMRAMGETMVVWMASGNAAQIPTPWYDLTSAVRTLTATIAGEMGETPRGTTHYHVLFAMALCLLLFCFVCNLVSEWVVKRNRKKMRGE